MKTLKFPAPPFTPPPRLVRELRKRQEPRGSIQHLFAVYRLALIASAARREREGRRS